MGGKWSHGTTFRHEHFHKPEYRPYGLTGAELLQREGVGTDGYGLAGAEA